MHHSPTYRKDLKKWGNNMNNYGDILRRVCLSQQLVPYIDAIYTHLDDNTRRRIEKSGLLLKTYAQVFKDAQPFDDGFCQRVNMLLDNRDYIIKLQTEKA